LSDQIDRREFLSIMWKVGAGLLAAAGAWATWDVFRSRATGGSGGPVATLAADSLIGDDVARSYLTRVDNEIIALSEACTHLHCRVTFCDSSGRFECPCHGTVYNRAGDLVSGPAPRGMDRHPVEIVDGVVLVDTSVTVEGPPPGTVTIDEPARGPACDDSGGA